MDLPDRETASYILERLIGEWRRYGRLFAIVRLELPADRLADALPRLHATLREADVLARWDDEELVVLLPETDQAGADSAAERLRAAVREVPMLAGAVQWTGGSAEGLVSRARWAAARAV
jgi:diguanylate cyclase with GGDEF domain